MADAFPPVAEAIRALREGVPVLERLTETLDLLEDDDGTGER
jgi:hypothetical protein